MWTCFDPFSRAPRDYPGAPLSEKGMRLEHEAIKHIVFERGLRAEVEGLDAPAGSLEDEILRAVQQIRGETKPD